MGGGAQPNDESPSPIQFERLKHSRGNRQKRVNVSLDVSQNRHEMSFGEAMVKLYTQGGDNRKNSLRYSHDNYQKAALLANAMMQHRLSPNLRRGQLDAKGGEDDDTTRNNEQAVVYQQQQSQYEIANSYKQNLKGGAGFVPHRKVSSNDLSSLLPEIQQSPSPSHLPRFQRMRNNLAMCSPPTTANLNIVSPLKVLVPVQSDCMMDDFLESRLEKVPTTPQRSLNRNRYRSNNKLIRVQTEFDEDYSNMMDSYANNAHNIEMNTNELLVSPSNNRNFRSAATMEQGQSSSGLEPQNTLFRFKHFTYHESDPNALIKELLTKQRGEKNAIGRRLFPLLRTPEPKVNQSSYNYCNSSGSSQVGGGGLVSQASSQSQQQQIQLQQSQQQQQQPLVQVLNQNQQANISYQQMTGVPQFSPVGRRYFRKNSPSGKLSPIFFQQNLSEKKSGSAMSRVESQLPERAKNQSVDNLRNVVEKSKAKRHEGSMNAEKQGQPKKWMIKPSFRLQADSTSIAKNNPSSKSEFTGNKSKILPPIAP